MNPGDEKNGTHAPFDEDAEFLRLRALYRELPAEEPSAALDDAILAAARRATGSRPRAAGWWSSATSSRRWRAPLAAAAVLLLAVGVLVQEPWQRSVMPEGLVLEQSADSEVSKAVAVKSERASSENAESPAAVPAVPVVQSRAPAVEGAEKAKRVIETTQIANNEARKAASNMAMHEMPAPAPSSVAMPAAASVPTPALAEDAAAEVVADEAVSVAAAKPTSASALTSKQTPAPTAARASAKKREVDAAAQAAPTEAIEAIAERVLPRTSPWPFGLVPTLAPDTACARLVQDSGGRCHGRVMARGLELALSGGDPDWLPQLRLALEELGWQRDAATVSATDTERYTRATAAGIESFGWRVEAGRVVLTLQAAGP